MAEEVAAAVQGEGFAALDAAAFGPTDEQLAQLKTQVLRRFRAFLERAGALGLDLKRAEDAERLAGFYAREGGRVDMQLSTSAVQTLRLDWDAPEVDARLLLEVEKRWRPVLAALFAAHESAGTADNFALEYVGCVLSRPGDEDQNWHLDGVHRNLTRHEPADRVNVFVPLVEIDDKTGGTEMKARSHIRSTGDAHDASSFSAYEHLDSVTHKVAAGTPVIMDYRVWHRGLANTSDDTVRPLLYFKYALRQPKRPAQTPASGAKKRKRIVPIAVQPPPK